jgi:hypothetical protein
MNCQCIEIKTIEIINPIARLKTEQSSMDGWHNAKPLSAQASREQGSRFKLARLEGSRFKAAIKMTRESLVDVQNGSSRASRAGGTKTGERCVKIIEAMKRVKANKDKIADLQTMIGKYCAGLNFETPTYGHDTHAKITEWLQSCNDLARDNARLLVAVARTNLATSVPILLGDKTVTKTIAEWVWRRREYAETDLRTWLQLSDRNLKEGTTVNSQGERTEVKIIRYFDPVMRDKMVAMFKAEPHEIDAALEVINAVTDLIED